MDTTRGILKITGNERAHFLQGLVSNDVGKLSGGPVYAALLSPQGKYLFDFIMVARDEAIFLDVAAQALPDLSRRLTLYKLRADVDISKADMPVVRGVGAAPEGAFPDPRDPALGWRAYGAEFARLDTGGVDWGALRVTHLIPATGAELIPNESYILEMGFERLNGVDFQKGCYVGQEVTARMKHKTTLKKGLRRVSLGGAVLPGAPILRDGKEVGTIHTVSGRQALAYLRFDRVGAGMRSGDVAVTFET